MTSYDRKYKQYAGLVRSSVGWVAAAGQARSLAETDAQIERHRKLMVSIRRKLKL